MKKILIIQTAFIGDVILATAIIEQIKAQYPNWQIDFLLRKGNEKLLLNNPHLNEVIIWDKRKNKYKNLARIISVIRKRKYDKVINIQRFFSTGLITALSNAKEKIGFEKNPLSFFYNKKYPHEISENESKIVHETERNFTLLSSFITSNSITPPKLYPNERDIESVNKYTTQAYICIAPCSVWFTKEYPKEHWIDFINQVPENISVYLLGSGKRDEDICNDIVQHTSHRSIKSLCNNLSFLESAALMNKALMNYANDSAPLHIASAMNAPITAVYCSTVPRFGYTPLSTNSFIVQIKEPLYCRPCGLHGYASCPEGHFKCAHEIQISQLVQSLEWAITNSKS